MLNGEVGIPKTSSSQKREEGKAIKDQREKRIQSSSPYNDLRNRYSVEIESSIFQRIEADGRKVEEARDQRDVGHSPTHLIRRCIGQV